VYAHKSKLSASDQTIVRVIKAIVTHRSPNTGVIDFDATLKRAGSISQTNNTTSAIDCQKTENLNNLKLYVFL
jgi:hypothetical protein